MRRQIVRAQAFEPGVFVGREDGVIAARGGAHFLALEHHLVFGGHPGAALRGQGLRDARIAVERRGFDIAVGINGRDAECLRQTRDFVGRDRMAHDERAAVRAQLRIEFGQRGMDEGHTPVGGVGERLGRIPQRIEDAAVEHEHAIHARMAGAGGGQGGIVGKPQVAAKPHQGAGHGGNVDSDRGCSGPIMPCRRAAADSGSIRAGVNACTPLQSNPA